MDLGKRLENTLPLIIIAIVFCSCSLLFIFSYSGLATNVWHGGIHLEQTSVALNYEDYGVFIPFSEVQKDILHLPPLYSWFTSAAIKLTGWRQAGKIVSLIFSLLTLPLVYRIATLLGYSRYSGYMATLLLATSPLFILLGSAIMQEATMIFFSVLTILFFTEYLFKEKEKYLFLCGLTIFLSAFSKWPGIFTLFPVGLCLIKIHKQNILRKPVAYFIAFFPLTVCFAWFKYIQAISITPPGNNIFNRLFYNVKMSIPAILAHIGRNWSIKLPLTHIVLAIIGLSMLNFRKDRDFLVGSWFVAGLLYYLVFLQGSLHHDHYPALMLPPMVVLGGIGLEHLASKLSHVIKAVNVKQVLYLIGAFLLVIILAGSCFITVVQSSKFRTICADAKEIGNYVSQNYSVDNSIMLENLHTNKTNTATYLVYFSLSPEFDVNICHNKTKLKNATKDILILSKKINLKELNQDYRIVKENQHYVVMLSSRIP